MKKVLLYYPKTAGKGETRPLYTGLPLSVLSLASQLDPQRYEVMVVDGRLDNWDFGSICKWLDDSLVCVGISSMTSYQIKDGLNFASFIRGKSPDTPIVWGGWHPSLMPRQTIRDEYVDIVIIGQGEVTFPQLLDKLAKGESLTGISNLVIKDGDKNLISTGLKPLTKLDDILPIERAYRYVDMERYIQPLWGNKRVSGYESSRGCPNNCKFCSIASVYKRRWNALSAERVVEGVKFLKNNYDIDAVHFYDNNFFVDFKRALDISRRIEAENLNVRWDGTAVVEQFIHVSGDDLEKLKKSGFYRVIIGIESGDEDVLARINKKHTNKQVLELVEKCSRHGIMPSLSFMVGFPWHPEQDVKNTIGLIEKIKNININTEILLFIFSPYLGTELYEIARGYGMNFPDSLEGWADYTYENINVPWITEKLARKINRYISFFGTKDMSGNMAEFLNASGKNRV